MPGLRDASRANRAPRFESERSGDPPALSGGPRLRWPRGSPCLPAAVPSGGRHKPQTLVKGKPGVRRGLVVTFEGGRKHLPVITLRRGARAPPHWPMRPGLGHGARSRRNLDYKERRISFPHFTSPPRGPRNGAKKHVSFHLSALTDGEPNFAGPLHQRSTL